MNYRLTWRSISDLVKISNIKNESYKIYKKDVKQFCKGLRPKNGTVQTYGIYEGKQLVSIMTATYMKVFPHIHSKKGKIVHITGAYTLPEYRNKGYATKLLKAIEKDAYRYSADYLCCDSTADDLYINNEFIYAPDNEKRMWKPLGS